MGPARQYKQAHCSLKIVFSINRIVAISINTSLPLESLCGCAMLLKEKVTLRCTTQRVFFLLTKSCVTARRIRTLAKEQEPSGSWRRMIKTVSAYKKLMPDEMTVLIALQSDRDETRAKRDRDPHIVLLRSIYKAKMDEKPRNGQLDAMPPAEKCWFKPYIDDDVKHSSPFNEDDEQQSS
ncbi:uncharacterized protein LOC129580687 isoform X2 [Paramacrobiotus metropolitanus]|uniref:uncharacterized protein LOC129580687 isoform X2 n=1 Tax=Paramacrobiotus metropolitanus TaxID=2943436 RepID=UPI0024457578|nr:uncharacterized protein LOC129580687 isoform X2 [Paramacrobiotus metropolitanus]